MSHEVSVGIPRAAKAFLFKKSIHDNANREAGRATGAGWCIGNRMAAPKSRTGKGIVEGSGFCPRKLSHQFPLDTALKIRARHRSRCEEEMRASYRRAFHVLLPMLFHRRHYGGTSLYV